MNGGAAEAYGPDEPANGQTLQAWLNQVQAMQAAIIQRQEFFPIAPRRLPRIEFDERSGRR